MARKTGFGGNNSMPTSWGSTLSGTAKSLAERPVGSLNTRRMGTLTVIVSVEQVDLRDFTNRVYGEIEARVRLAGGIMPVTDDEYFKYCVTALKTRTLWTIRGRFDIRVDDTWALPVPVAQVLSAIGIVEDGPGTRYVPAWNVEADQYTLTREEWEDVTRRLLALEVIPGVSFIHAIEKNVEGIERVMLLMQGEEEGTEFFFSNTPIHALEALVSLIAGLTPGRRVDVGSLPPQLVPAYTVSRDWVVGFMHEFSIIGNAG